MEIRIMSIDKLLQIPNLATDDKIGIVLITLRPNYYDFGQAKVVYLDIADTDTPVIEQYHMYRLNEFIAFKECYNVLYVCCDAGLSRSPAVALYLARKLNLTKQAKQIDEKYQFLNTRLYLKLENIEWK